MHIFTDILAKSSVCNNNVVHKIKIFISKFYKNHSSIRFRAIKNKCTLHFQKLIFKQKHRYNTKSTTLIFTYLNSFNKARTVERS